MVDEEIKPIENLENIENTEPTPQSSKSTIYVSIPVKENLKVKCPHCSTRFKLARRDNIVTCSHCFEYMHVVYIRKGNGKDIGKKTTNRSIN